MKIHSNQLVSILIYDNQLRSLIDLNQENKNPLKTVDFDFNLSKSNVTFNRL
jgi:hypothetical protein